MTNNQKPGRVLIKYYALKRLLMWRHLSNRLPLYLVAEFPKSGGTWFSQMLADILGWPFPRNNTPPKTRRCVLHGHHLYDKRFHNVSVVHRDGRDIMVSAYHHFLFYNEWNSTFFVDKVRNRLGFKDINNVQENLPLFIEYMFTEYSKGRFHFTWADFVRSWIDRDVPTVKYEDLSRDAVSEMRRMVLALTGIDTEEEKVKNTVEKYSFSKIANRDRGNENKSSFIRKGISGDWCNYFNSASKDIFNYYAGDALIMLGYEKDLNWIKDGLEVGEVIRDVKPSQKAVL